MNAATEHGNIDWFSECVLKMMGGETCQCMGN